MFQISEKLFFRTLLSKNIKIVFDVGTRDDSLFINNENLKCYFFEPNEITLNELRKKEKNINSVFINYGLSDKKEIINYNSLKESFLDRSKSLRVTGKNKKFKNIFDSKKETIKGSDYIINNNLQEIIIDFIKIDVEGYEMNVIKGFEDYIKNFKVIQFEYGACIIDADNTFLDFYNYLTQKGFYNFYSLGENEGKLSLRKIEDIYTNPLEDHRKYGTQNLICFNKKLVSEDFLKIFKE